MPQRLSPESISICVCSVTSSADGGVAQAARGDLAVDVDRHLRGVRHPREPRPLVVPDRRIGEDHVATAAVDEHLGLRRLGGRDPAGTRRLRHQCDLGDLVGLDVRPEPLAGSRDQGLPGLDVALDHVEVDDQRRRRHVVEALSRTHPRAASRFELGHRRLLSGVQGESLAVDVVDGELTELVLGHVDAVLAVQAERHVRRRVAQELDPALRASVADAGSSHHPGRTRPRTAARPR